MAKLKKGFMTLLVLHWQNWKRFSWYCYTGKTGKGFYDTVTLARLGNVDRVNLNEDHFTDNKEYWGYTCGSCHLGLVKLFCLQLDINVYQHTLFQCYHYMMFVCSGGRLPGMEWALRCHGQQLPSHQEWAWWWSPSLCHGQSHLLMHSPKFSAVIHWSIVGIHPLL